MLLEVFTTQIFHKFQERGIGWFLGRVLKRACLELAWLALLPVALLMHLLGFRRVFVNTQHIGHLAADFDAFFKEVRLGLVFERKWFAVESLSRVSNQHLLKYWEACIPVFTGPFSSAVLEILTRRYFVRHDLSHYSASYFGTQEIYRVNRVWDRRPAILTLSADDADWAADALVKLGIPPDRWFACVHVREGGFLPNNELVQSHRSASIFAAVPAISEIVSRGGICVRVGDPSMTRLPAIEGVIDYAHHPDKSARMDIVLCATARFFLGGASGLPFVSAVFGVPVAHANMIPVATLGIRYCDISIPKLIWSNSLSRHLRFSEILRSEIGGYFFSHQYKRAGLRVDDNSPEEIADLVREMLDRLDNRFLESSEDIELQTRYMSLFQDGAYSYGAASRIGAGFLRRHADLLL